MPGYEMEIVSIVYDSFYYGNAQRLLFGNDGPNCIKTSVPVPRFVFSISLQQISNNSEDDNIIFTFPVFPMSSLTN